MPKGLTAVPAFIQFSQYHFEPLAKGDLWEMRMKSQICVGVWARHKFDIFSYIFNFFSQRHKSYCYVFSKKALSCSLNICSRSYSRCLVEKAAISSLVWKYGNSFSYCESSAPSNSNWDKKFGWVFDKVAILGSNLKFPPSICKPQQQGPNPVQLTFNLENSKFLDLLPVQYLFYIELSGRLPGSHTLIILSREYLLIFT